MNVENFDIRKKIIKSGQILESNSKMFFFAKWAKITESSQISKIKLISRNAASSKSIKLEITFFLCLKSTKLAKTLLLAAKVAFFAKASNTQKKRFFKLNRKSIKEICLKGLPFFQIERFVAEWTGRFWKDLRKAVGGYIFNFKIWILDPLADFAISIFQISAAFSPQKNIVLDKRNLANHDRGKSWFPPWSALHPSLK